MEKYFYSSAKRGKADYGWLKANYSFSFANYYNPDLMGFGALRVLNDDAIAPAQGFGTHPHKNMEIITIPLSGALKHVDSMGHESVIVPGEVQVMSAGTGIFHSEFNASGTDPLQLFQIWIVPDREGIEPRYDQKKFAVQQGALRLFVSPDGRDGSMQIARNAFISRASLNSGDSFRYAPFDPDNGLFMMLVDGRIVAEGQNIGKRDALSFVDFEQVNINAEDNSDLLFIEVPI